MGRRGVRDQYLIGHGSLLTAPQVVLPNIASRSRSCVRRQTRSMADVDDRVHSALTAVVAGSGGPVGISDALLRSLSRRITSHVMIITP